MLIRMVKLAALVLTIFASSAFADNPRVTIQLKDRSFAIEGDLLSFDAEYYELSTDLGVLTFSADTTRCVGADCPDPNDFVPSLKIASSPTLGELLIPTLLENFAASRGYRLAAKATSRNSLEIDALAPGSGHIAARIHLVLLNGLESYQALASQDADIIFSHRGPTESEIADLKNARRTPLKSQIVGWESLRLYTKENGPVEALTVRQLSEITRDENQTWPDFPDLPVYIEGDTDNIIALHQTMDRNLPDPILPKSRVTGDGVLFVTPNLSLPYQHIPVSANCGTPVKYSEDDFGAHPLRAPIFMTAANRRLPKVFRDFQRYVLSVSAQRAVARSGFESRTPTESRLDADQSILLSAVLNSGNDVRLSDFRNAVKYLKDFGRLSLTFRFLDGSKELDDTSKSNLRFLAELLQQGRYANREVLFAGFSDSSGAAAANLRLSESRAKVVRDAVVSMMDATDTDLTKFKVRGFGEVLPLACNDTDWGQHQNRRVEIWLK